MPKISEEQRVAARQRLIDATVAVAKRDGAEALTTRAIVAEAGVSAGMFYGHFDSKEALLTAVVEQKVEELSGLVSAEIDIGTPIEGALRGLLEALVRTLDLRVLAAFRGLATEDEHETHRVINERIVAAFRPVVELGVDAGVVRAGLDVDGVIEFIDIVIDGLNRRRNLHGFVTSDARVVDVVLDTIERALLAPTPHDNGATP